MPSHTCVACDPSGCPLPGALMWRVTRPSVTGGTCQAEVPSHDFFPRIRMSRRERLWCRSEGPAGPSPEATGPGTRLSTPLLTTLWLTTSLRWSKPRAGDTGESNLDPDLDPDRDPTRRGIQAGMGEGAQGHGAVRGQRDCREPCCASRVPTLPPDGNPDSAVRLQPVGFSYRGLWQRSFYHTDQSARVWPSSRSPEGSGAT